jgi:AI-2 transport protein TqsA
MNKSIQYLLGVASVIIIIAGMKIGADLINPILVSFMLAICITPLPEWMARKGMNTNLALGITFLLILVLGGLISVMLANSVSGLSESLPVYEQKLTEYANQLLQFAQAHHLNVSKLFAKANIAPEKIVNFAGSLAGSLSSLISNSLLIMVLMVCFVIEMVGYESETRKGKRDKVSLHEWLVSLIGDLRKFNNINAREGLILAVMNYFFLLFMGVEFAFLWAFLSFFMNFVPNIGLFLSIIPPAIVSLIMLGPEKTLIVIVGLTLINIFVENVLNALFMKQGLKVSLLNSFLSMMFWGWILGPTGAILGIPLTMVLMKIHEKGKDKIETK